MLKKLFAYDFRCIGRISLPAILGMLGSAIFSLLFLFMLEKTSLGNTFILSFIATFGFICCLIVLILFLSAPMFINYIHFAKNLYFDEGYLTMTLPASEHQLLLSKIFSGFLWLLIDAVMAVISFAILFLGAAGIFGAFSAPAPEFPEEAFPFMDQLLGMILSYVLYGIVYAAFEVVLGMMVITFGCLLMPKHKVLGILLAYMVSNWTVGLINSLLSIAVSDAVLSLGLVDAYLYAQPLLLSVLMAALTVGCYFLTHRMLKKRINLE